MSKRAAVLTAVLLGLTGCGFAQQPAGAPPRPSDVPPNQVSALAIPAGRIDEAVAKVDGLVADLMRSSGIPDGRGHRAWRKVLYAKDSASRM